ncbi:hypothetical protein SISNIDRAFT_9657 [Sistotremastrum niveocremeum HHB9708]|uniref:Translocation protein sec66 n=1 Tax=Sistotremastrum niveocremeum HHB9708 TaxID=1314777 RepID=A0A165AIB6_9AGAM|nr:hypothetical protein SISNIDRAFT_9657 [Sistotremastrum niveocremeum HHB9708]
MASILAPVLYVAILLGSLLIFSRVYRRRLASQRKFDPWFPSHPERDLYVTLLQQSNPPAPDAVLKAALLRRAAADLVRIQRIREDKQALQALIQKGSVGDDLWNSCLAAEKELEAELIEVVGEANTFHEQWGQIIFATASELNANEKIKAVLMNMPKMRAEAGAVVVYNSL